MDFATASFDTAEAHLGLQDSPDKVALALTNYVVSMTESVTSRARKMSQSSNERELSTDFKPPPKDEIGEAGPESRGTKRKFSNDAVDYPRRRATIAVRTLSS